MLYMKWSDTPNNLQCERGLIQLTGLYFEHRLIHILRVTCRNEETVFMLQQ